MGGESAGEEYTYMMGVLTDSRHSERNEGDGEAIKMMALCISARHAVIRARALSGVLLIYVVKFSPNRAFPSAFARR